MYSSQYISNFIVSIYLTDEIYGGLVTNKETLPLYLFKSAVTEFSLIILILEFELLYISKYLVLFFNAFINVFIASLWIFPSFSNLRILLLIPGNTVAGSALLTFRIIADITQ